MDVPLDDLTTVTVLQYVCHLERSLLTLYPVETCKAVFSRTNCWSYETQKEISDIRHILMNFFKQIHVFKNANIMENIKLRKF